VEELLETAVIKRERLVAKFKKEEMKNRNLESKGKKERDLESLFPVRRSVLGKRNFKNTEMSPSKTNLSLGLEKLKIESVGEAKIAIEKCKKR
jgi:hypothetical protein